MTLEEELKHKIFGYPSREDVVLWAMRKYNAQLGTARRKIEKFAATRSESAEIILRRTGARLPDMIADDEQRAAEGDKLAENIAKKRAETLAVLEPIIQKIEAGMPYNRAMTGIYIPSRIPDYRKYMEWLQEREIIVVPGIGESASHAIRRIAGHQVLLLEREHAIPAPLSQTLIKEPDISRAKAVDNIVEYYIRREEERRIVTVRRGLGRRAVSERAHEKIYEKIKRDMRRYKRENEERLREQALAAVSDLPQYTRLGLTRSAALKEALQRNGRKGRISITNLLLEETHLTPEKVFAAAFTVADADKRYLTGIYHGVERSRQHILVFDNIEAAARIIIYTREMTHNGQQLALFRISELYANTIEGKVLSRSGIKDAYETHVVSLPIFSSKHNVAWRTPFETETRCSCKDAAYMAAMHAKAQYPFIYTDTHAVALAFYAMLHAVKSGGFVINPFPLPREAQLDFNKRTVWQVLIRSRMDGNVYTPNKAEREVLKIKNAQEIEYEKAYTHDVEEGLQIMRTALLE